MIKVIHDVVTFLEGYMDGPNWIIAQSGTVSPGGFAKPNSGPFKTKTTKKGYMFQFM